MDSIWSAKLVPAVLSSAVDARVLLDASADARAGYVHSCCFLVKGTGHVGMLRKPEVWDQIERWLVTW